MDYIWLKIAGLALFIFGWLLGYNYSSRRLEKIEKGLDFLEETSEIITVESAQIINADRQIRLLLAIDDSDINLAQEHLIEDLGTYFSISKDTIKGGMANDNEKEIVARIEELAKNHDLFTKVIQYTP